MHVNGLLYCRWVFFKFVLYRRHRRSASCHQLFVPWRRCSTFGRQTFSVAGPSVWNSLSDSLRDPARSVDWFRRHLKTFLLRLSDWHRHFRGWLAGKLSVKSFSLFYHLCSVYTASQKTTQLCYCTPYAVHVVTFPTCALPLLCCTCKSFHQSLIGACVRTWISPRPLCLFLSLNQIMNL